MSLTSAILPHPLWLGHAQALAAAALVVVAVLGAGALLGRWLPPGRAAVDRALTASLLGLAVLGPALYWAGHLGWSRRGLAVVLGGLAIVGLRQLLRDRMEWRAAARSAVRSPFAWIAAAGLLLVITSGLAEPLGGIENEAVASTLLAGRQWLLRGTTGYVPDHPCTALPWNIETLYAAALALGGPPAAGVLGAGWLALLAGLAWRIARDFSVPPPWAPSAAALVVTMPLLHAGADLARPEVAFATLALGSWRAALAAREPRAWLLAAVLAGGAAATMLAGWLVAVLSLVVAGGVLWWRRGPHAVLRTLPAALLIVAALGAPWFVRNVFVLGTPLVPPPPWGEFFLPSVGWTPQLAIDVHHWWRAVWLGPAAQPWGLPDFFALPWRLQTQAADFQSAPPGLAGLAALVPGIWLLRRRPAAWWAFAWALAGLLAWFLTWHNARLLTPLAALACVAGAAAFAACAGRTAWPRLGLALLGILLAWTAAAGGYTFVEARRQRLVAVFSPSAAEARRATEIPFRETLDLINRDPAVRRVLLLTKWPPGYYLEKPYFKVAGHFGESPHRDAPNYDRALAHAADLGCTHVLDIRDVREGWHVWQPDSALSRIGEWPDARLYSVGSAGPNTPP